MRIAVRALTNRVQLRTIITYDFMLYGNRRFRGTIGRSASLTVSTKTRARNCCSRDLEGLLSSFTSKVGESTSTGLPPATCAKHQNSSHIRAKWVFCLRRQYTHGTPSPFRVVLRASAPLNRLSETEKPSCEVRLKEEVLSSETEFSNQSSFESLPYCHLRQRNSSWGEPERRGLVI